MSEESRFRHLCRILNAEEPTALCIVSVTALNRFDQWRDKPRIHLAFTVDLHDYITAIGHGSPIICHGCAANTLIRVEDDRDKQCRKQERWHKVNGETYERAVASIV